jgi:hypothetical protein
MQLAGFALSSQINQADFFYHLSRCSSTISGSECGTYIAEPAKELAQRLTATVYHTDIMQWLMNFPLLVGFPMYLIRKSKLMTQYI